MLTIPSADGSLPRPTWCAPGRRRGSGGRGHRLPDGLGHCYTIRTRGIGHQYGRGQRARPKCERRVVAADLRGDWPARLVTAGFEPAEPAAWLAEGLLIYLTADHAAHVLTAVSGLSAPASRLSVERGNTGASLVAETTPASPASAPPASAPEPATPADRALTALWQGGLGEDPTLWLARRGWQSQIHHLAALADSYGRPAPANSRSGFVTATYAGRRPHP